MTPARVAFSEYDQDPQKIDAMVPLTTDPLSGAHLRDDPDSSSETTD